MDMAGDFLKTQPAVDNVTTYMEMNYTIAFTVAKCPLYFSVVTDCLLFIYLPSLAEPTMGKQKGHMNIGAYC